jgi:PAS domain S-box-containing protein
LAAHHRQLEAFAENCPENFENRAALVGAEIARIEGREFEAMRLYEQAIRSSHTNGFVHNEALASELAARFYVARGFNLIAHAYLRKARFCYLRWGAAGKVRQLDELYPGLREDEPVPGPTSTIGTPVENLDLATVIKVSQAVSGEIVLEKLIDTLMRTAIENAGAERGLVILRRGVEQWIEAEATTSGDTIIVRSGEASVAEATVPQSIIHYVLRTEESVILDDASVQNPFSTDDYIRQQHARSVLCLPLIKQARLIGVLYLENNLAPHVFTPARIAVLKLLASQAAISLENTYLYRDLEEREAKIRRLVDANIVGIFIWNLDGKIIGANEAFLHMVGYSRDDLTSGRVRWTDLTPADWRDRDERAMVEVKATGTVQPYQKEYIRKDGSRVPVLLGAAFFERSENEGVAFVLDLSERKRSEEALRRSEEAWQKAQAELAHVSRVATMGELTASIAHEINQPLGAIANNAQAGLRFLATGSENLQDVKEALSDILKGADRVNGIIVRMRAMAKKAPPEMAQLNFKDIVADVLIYFQHELTRRHVEIELQLSKELPPVLADRVQLQQVLLNLVMNGVEAMNEVPEASRKIWVRAQPSEHNGSPAVLISVQDSGRGLKQADADRLFEAFYTTKSHGLGMGLAISRSIVEAHGGRLWLASTAGPGATFQFVLPATGQS